MAHFADRCRADQNFTVLFYGTSNCQNSPGTGVVAINSLKTFKPITVIGNFSAKADLMSVNITAASLRSSG
jgi:hypothetical protein